MGKATELDIDLDAHSLTAAEADARRAAEAISDPDVRVSLSGQFEKPSGSDTEVVHERQTATWD